MASPEITMSKMPVRIDGVSQDVFVEERLFKPEGVLEHQYIPLETVITREAGNDLVYSCSYWSVERYFRVFLPKHIYDRLMSRFLQGREVLIDYSSPKKPRVYLPRDEKADGFQTIYRNTVNDLRAMSADELENRIASMGFDPVWTAADYYLNR